MSRPRRWPSALGIALVGLAASGAPAAPRPGRATRVAAAIVDDAPRLGPAIAPVTIEAFLNPADGWLSGQIHDVLVALARRHPRRVRVIYRIGAGPTAPPHVLAVLEAHAQGRFLEFMAALYGPTRRSPREDALPEAGARAGLDPVRLAEALTPGSARAAELEAIARRTYHDRRRRLVPRVPALVINGEPIDRRINTLEDVEALYDEAYAAARARLDAGVAPERLHDVLVAERRRSRAEPDPGPLALDGERDDEPVVRAPSRLHLDLRRGARLGPADAPVTIVFACNLVTRPCLQAASTLGELREAFPDEVQLRYRPLFDLADEAQAGADRLARVARCAARLDRFEAVFQRLTVRRGRGDELDDEDLDELATDAGLEPVRMRRCVDDPATAREIAREVAATRDAGFARTPSIALDGQRYLGARSFEELVTWTERALAPGILGGAPLPAVAPAKPAADDAGDDEP